MKLFLILAAVLVCLSSCVPRKAKTSSSATASDVRFLKLPASAKNIRFWDDGNNQVATFDVPEEDFRRMFAKFHHGAVEGGGTDIGLGLAICRSIVRLHDGRAWAESVPGGGTAFRFSLPLEPPPLPPPRDDVPT